MGKLIHYSSKPQRPSESSQPRLRIQPWRCTPKPCTPEPWPYYKVSMSGVFSHCHKSWGSICAIGVLVDYIQSVLVFKTQRSTDKLWTGYRARAVPHQLYRNHNRYHHQFQNHLSMAIILPSCSSTQMASAITCRN